MNKPNETCKRFLQLYRQRVGAKSNEKIDKRYSTFLAPNDKVYDNNHCVYCAEVEYLQEIHREDDVDVDKSSK